MISDFSRFFPVDHPEAQGPEAHILKAADALNMQTAGPGWTHIDFRGEAFIDLLTQEGARGLRVFPVFNGHHTSLGFVALDANGEPLSHPEAIAIENGERCPPFC